MKKTAGRLLLVMVVWATALVAMVFVCVPDAAFVLVCAIAEDQKNITNRAVTLARRNDLDRCVIDPDIKKLRRILQS